MTHRDDESLPHPSKDDAPGAILPAPMKLDLLFWLRLGGTMHALLLIPLFLAGAFTYWEGPPKAPHYAGFFVICAVLCLAAVPPMWLGSKDGKPAS